MQITYQLNESNVKLNKIKVFNLDLKNIKVNNSEILSIKKLIIYINIYTFIN